MHRRLALRWMSVATIVLASAIAATLPAAATAAYSGTLAEVLENRAQRELTTCRLTTTGPCRASIGYRGWTKLTLNNCPIASASCKMPHRSFTTAYRWNPSSGWIATSLREGYVYVQFFGGYYRWAWTQQSGWVAVSVDEQREVFFVV